jgi:hypothetical protein
MARLSRSVVPGYPHLPRSVLFAKWTLAGGGVPLTAPLLAPLRAGQRLRS